MKQAITKVILLTLFIVVSALGASRYELQQEFNAHKRNYLKSVLNDNRANQIRYLNKLVYVGSQLRISTVKYKNELRRLDGKLETKKHRIQIQQQRKIQPVSTVSKYTITNVEQTSNSITLSFARNITKRDMKFLERRKGSLYEDVFEFRGHYKYAKPTKLKIKGIDKILIYQSKHNTLKIVVRDRSNPRTVYIINKNKIIIKFLNVSNKTQSKSKAKTQLYIPPKKTSYKSGSKVIVVDPGHGGKDPGALGKGKRREKNVTLSISKKLVSILKSRGYKVYITRSRDKYISLKRRTNTANKRHADLFISVHANAAHKSRVNKAKGIETFFLSPARSERAKRVAAKENKGDMDAMNWSSKQSFLTVLNQGKITASNKLAIDIHKNMLFNLKKNYRGIVDGGVREGPFWVLVGAQMPSVLIEVGYITHPVEGKRMFTSKYQNLMANGIANGIDSYFSKNE